MWDRRPHEEKSWRSEEWREVHKTAWWHVAQQPKPEDPEHYARGMYSTECETPIQKRNYKGELFDFYENAKPKDYCTEHTSSSNYRADNLCHRPVKDEKLHMCGIHAARERKINHEDEQRKLERELSAWAQEAAEVAVANYKKVFGEDAEVEAEYNYRASSGFTGRIVVNPEELFEKLEELYDRRESGEGGEENPPEIPVRRKTGGRSKKAAGS